MRRSAPAAPTPCACGTRSKRREDPEWTRRYRATDPNELSFGGRVEIFMRDGSKLEDEMAVANAHPIGARPFGRADYIRKFQILTDGIITHARVEPVPGGRAGLADSLPAGELHQL